MNQPRVQNRPNRGKGDRTTRRHWAAGLVVLAALALAGWAGLGAKAHAAAAKPHARKLDKITLQLRSVTQAQFAGYYAAKQLGYYKDFGLDVNIKIGGPQVTPEQVVASGQAQIGLDWLPSLLAFRDQGTNLVNIAQMFTRSGMAELTWKTSGITSIAKMRGKTVGVWCCGNQWELYAALSKNGIDPNNKNDVKILNQPFDMKAFLNHQIDAAAAMTYNELAEVLETPNPKTHKLYTLGDLNVMKMQAQGTGMLEDGLFTTSSWLKKPSSRDIATRFIAASDRGWIYCRGHAAACVDIVLKNGPTLGKGHQTWQMNEINALIWPAPLGIGVMNSSDFNRTAAISLKYKQIKKAASAAASYDHQLAKAALQYLKNHVSGIDVVGKGWHKAVVHVTAGGK